MLRTEQSHMAGVSLGHCMFCQWEAGGVAYRPLAGTTFWLRPGRPLRRCRSLNSICEAAWCQGACLADPHVSIAPILTRLHIRPCSGPCWPRGAPTGRLRCRSVSRLCETDSGGTCVSACCAVPFRNSAADDTRSDGGAWTHSGLPASGIDMHLRQHCYSAQRMPIVHTH